jgi:hypothetical protein
MAAVEVTLACGCTVKADANAGADEQPRCDVHGESRVTRVKAGTPRFKGAAQGPLAVEDKGAR